MRFALAKLQAPRTFFEQPKDRDNIMYKRSCTPAMLF